MGQAGTLMIDTPRLCKFFVGSDVPLPPATKGFIQLRKYTPKDPVRSPFQVFNFYLKSGGDFPFNSRLVESLSAVEAGIPTFVCGDLNFIEELTDTTSADPRLPTKDFLKVWDSFLKRFDICDMAHDAHTHFHITSDPLSPFSHSSRLDRFLVPTSVSEHPIFFPSVNIPHHITNYSLSHRTGTRASFSDHLPVRLSFNGEATRVPGRPTIPRWLAESPVFVKTLREKWLVKETSCPFTSLVKFKKALFSAARAARKVKIEAASLPLSCFLNILPFLDLFFPHIRTFCASLKS